MRTSNKILLGTFLTAIFALSAIHVALYAKYKSGGYTTLKAIREDNFTHHKLENITKIVAIGMENVNILPADTARLDIEKAKHGYVRFEIKDGTLIIRGDSIVSNNKSDNIMRSYQEVNISLPTVEKITADFSVLHIKGSKDSSSAKSYELDLKNKSSFDFRDIDDDDSTFNYFKNLVIRSEGSDIGFNRLMVIANLNLALSKSNFHDNSCIIDNFTMQLDSLSRINMHGNNLLKAGMLK